MTFKWSRRRWMSGVGLGLGGVVFPPWVEAAQSHGPRVASPSGPPGPGTPEPEAARGSLARPQRWLEIAGPWELSGLALSQSGHLYQKMQVVETLLDASGVGHPEPALASAWTCSDDGLRWQFVLRAGARFHDGTAVRVEDVVASLQAARRPPGLLSQAPIHTIHALDPVASPCHGSGGAQACTAQALEIQLNQPHATLPSLLAHFSAAVLAPGSFGPDGRTVTQIIGSGPYRITRLQPPQLLETAWYDGYGGPPPEVRRARYLAVGRAETRALMAASGQADLVFALDPASVAKWKRREPHRARVNGQQARLASVTVPRVMALKVNAGSGPLSDLRVRQALSLAVDREGIALAVLREPDLAATQLLPPTLPDWHSSALPPLRFDLTQARRLLHAAGWQAGADGRSWMDAAGHPVTLTLRTFPDRPELPIVATALQEQWRQLGIPVRVAIGNSGDIPLGHRDGSLQMALMARNYASAPDVTASLWQDFRPEGSDWGAMGWRSPEVAQALARLNGGEGAADTAADRRRVVQRLQQELPVIPIAWYRQHVAVSGRLADPPLDPLERSYRLTSLRWADSKDTT
jgi:peptide/nickel transport system substrate-binding protein